MPHDHHERLQLMRRDDLRSLPWAAVSRLSSKGQLVRIVDPFTFWLQQASHTFGGRQRLGGARVPLSTAEVVGLAAEECISPQR